MSALELCRTAALGGHIERCDHCDHQRICYNSCRDRHRPKCQSLARAQWLDDRRSELLDTQYFHVVFTTRSPLQLLPTAFYSGPPARRWAPSQLTPSIWARNSDSSRYFMLGVSSSFSPSASALRGSGGNFSGWHAMDFLPAQVLFARSRVGTSVSSTVSRFSPEVLRRRRLGIVFFAGIASDARRLLASHRAYPERLCGLREAALRRT